jgi:hypothetical protein
MKRILIIAAIFALLAWVITTPLQAEDESTVLPINQIEFPRIETQAGGGTFTVRAMDVWGDGNLAVVSAGPVVHIVDLSDIENPSFHTLTLEDGNEAWDVKIQNNILYASIQVSTQGAALLIYDVSNPAEPVFLSEFRTDLIFGSHNVFIHEKVAFLSAVGGGGAGLAGVWMVDISDPANPIDLGPLTDDNGTPIRSHDLTVIENRAYIAGWDTGIWIVDFGNLDNPQELTYTVVANHLYEPALRTRNSPNPATHNLWPSADGNLLWSTDEIVGEGVRVLDISDLDNIEVLDFYSLEGTNVLPHNVIVDGEFAYVAHYLEGLRVLAFQDGEIIEVAMRDTAGNNERTNPFRGAFGVFPMGDYVLISDTFNGLLTYAKEDLLN